MHYPQFFGLKGRRDTARGETPGIATTDGLPSLCGLEGRGDASPAVGVVRDSRGPSGRKNSGRPPNPGVSPRAVSLRPFRPKNCG